MSPQQYPLSPGKGQIATQAFTLIELLIALGIMVIIFALVGPAVNALKGASDLQKATYDIAGILEQARAYAVANSTYVFVGFQEVDASASTSAPTQSAGAGRVVVAVVASKNGTLGPNVDSNNLRSTWTSNYSNGANLVPVQKLLVIEQLHIADSLGTPPSAGGMARPSTSAMCRIGNSSFTALTTFAWPLGKALGAGKYNFTKVLAFSPRGVPNVFNGLNGGISLRYEIALQPTRGNASPTPPPNPAAGAQAAIIIDGATGAFRIYRP